MYRLLVSVLFVSRLFAQADTVIQPGHLDWTRYGTPGLCVEAVKSEARVAQRATLDTGAYRPDRDSLPARALTVAHACGTRFTPANVAARELVNLVRLGLMRGDITLAHAAAERWLSSIHDPSSRALALFQLVETYMDLRPMHQHEAATLVARLDSLGQPAILERVNARGFLWADRYQRFDVSGVEQQAVPLLAVNDQVSQMDSYDQLDPAGNIVGSLINTELFRSPATTVERVMQLARQAGYKWTSDPDQVATFIGALISPVGQAPPALPVKYWFGPHGGDSWIVPGKASLLMEVTVEEFSGTRDFGLLRRLRQRYGDALSVTLVVSTAGFVRTSPPLEGAQEADSIRHYFQDYLALPVTVGVQERPFHRLADGRRVNDALPNDDVNSLYYHGAVLVDQAGHVVVAAGTDEAELDAFLDRVITPATTQ